MKNIFNFFTVLCAVFGVLVLAGCADQSDFDKLPSGNKNKGLRITINGDGAERSTLYPSAIFSKYELHFEEKNGAVSYNSVEVPADKKTVTLNDLPNGTWEIKAIGYVTINGEDYPAAEGTEIVTVSGAVFKGININISAQQGGDPGFFSYSIGLPSTVNYAYLYIYNFQNLSSSIQQRYLPDDSADTIELPSGYYLMNITMYTPYRTVAWIEVIHIYSNMETKAERVYTEEDLTKIIIISGKVNVSFNDTPYSDHVYISFYRNSHNGNYFSRTSVYPDGDGKLNLNWSLPVLDAPVMFYPVIELNNGFRKNLDPIELYNADKEIIIDVNVNTIKVSGSANIIVNGEPVQDGYVDAEGIVNYKYYGASQIKNGEWEMNFEPFVSPTEVRFTLNFNVNNSWFEREVTRTLYDVDISNVDFNINLTTITLSGTIDVVVNGQIPDEIWGGIYLGSNNTNRIGNTYVYFDGDKRYWSGVIESFNTPTTVNIQFEYDIYDVYHGSFKFSVDDVSNQDKLDINITKNISTEKISGTANITIDGIVPDGIWLYICSDADWHESIAGFRVSSDGTWSIDIDNSYFDRDLYFILVYYFEGIENELAAELGPKRVDNNNLFFNLDQNIDTITLSGTVNLNVKLNGQPYNGDLDLFSYVAIDQPDRFAFAVNLDHNNNTWSAKIAPFKTQRTLYFYPGVILGGEHLFSWGDDWDDLYIDDYAAQIIVSGSSVSNINIGTLDLDFEGVLLSGNIDIVEEGIVLTSKIIRISLSGTSMWEGRGNHIKNDGSWTILWKNSFNAPTDIYFWIYARDINGNVYQKYTNVTRTIQNTNLTGINLGTHGISSFELLEDW